MVILNVLGVVILWFVAGFILNVLLYGHLPISERKESKQGRGIHILLNILTVIFIFYLIFN